MCVQWSRFCIQLDPGQKEGMASYLVSYSMNRSQELTVFEKRAPRLEVKNQTKSWFYYWRSGSLPSLELPAPWKLSMDCNLLTSILLCLSSLKLSSCFCCTLLLSQKTVTYCTNLNQGFRERMAWFFFKVCWNVPESIPSTKPIVTPQTESSLFLIVQNVAGN